MKHQFLSKERDFITSYFNQYGGRNPLIRDYFSDDFVGLDGISTKIYNKTEWLMALEDDFEQISKPFNIRVSDFDFRVLENGDILAVAVSFWDIELFQDMPEYDKIRSVFVMQPKKNSYSISHLSNSISLIALKQNEIYPFTLRKLLNNFKKTGSWLGEASQIS